MVRVLNPQRLTYNQILVEYCHHPRPPPPPPPAHHGTFFQFLDVGEKIGAVLYHIYRQDNLFSRGLAASLRLYDRVVSLDKKLCFTAFSL